MNKTKELILLIDDLFVLYNEKREIDLQKNIEAFNLVKDDISKHIELAEAWEEEALELINNNKTSLFFQQVNATKDNLIKLIFISFYHDLRMKLYINLFNFYLFIFNLFVYLVYECISYNNF